MVVGFYGFSFVSRDRSDKLFDVVDGGRLTTENMSNEEIGAAGAWITAHAAEGFSLLRESEPPPTITIVLQQTVPYP